jgi:DNA polymerase elongation subunit (family B)
MSNISDHFFRQNEIEYNENEDFHCQLIDAIAIDEEPPEDEEGGGFSYNFKGEYTVYFFGITKKSETVCIRVSGYQPSFFMNVPDNWKSGYNGDTFQLQKHLTSKDATFVDNWGKKKKIKWFNSRNIKLRTFKAKKFDGFQINEHHNFVEIKFNSHIAMKQTYRYLDSIKSKILKVPGVRQIPIKLYEADIDPLLRMCHKSNITPCSWVQLNKGRFTCVEESEKKSHSQYEFNINWRDIHPYETDDIAPFLVASYDIECTSGDGSFPQPTRPQDKLIQIGTTVRMFNNPEYELNHIITLKSCNKFTDDPNTIVDSYDTEVEVIMAWQELIQKVNPDIITGYNILGFDYWYLYERAQMFGIEEEFGYLGKLNPDKFENEFIKGKLISKLREKSLSSAALGDNKMKILDMIGRVNIDLLNFVRRTQKFKSYKLDFVSTKIINGEIINCQIMENGLCRMSVDNTVGLFKGGYFSINMKTKIELADKDIYIADDENYFTLNGSKKFLIEDFEEGKYLYVKEDLTQLNKEKCRWGLSKDDVTPAQIFEFQGKDAHHRGIVAKYCVQDCRLCNILMDKLCVIPNEIGMGQTCCVPLSYIFFRGQGIKVQSLVSRQCRKDGYLMPVREKDTSGCSYKGATVLNACNGAHFYPVACLDFASLYPSCMLSHNLCIESVIENKAMIKELDRQRKAKELIPVRETKYQGDQFFYKAKMYSDKPEMIPLKDRLIFPSIWVDEGVTYCYYFVQPKRKFDENGNILQDEHGQDIIDFKDRAILPRILRMLLDTRKATKKRMKKEKNPFKKKILDGLQLAYKVTANSIYGATGASVGCISCKKVAGSVTMVGRSLLATSRDKILDYYEGSKCVYGDSVTSDTPILIRYPNGKISIRTIETLNDEWKSYEEFKPFDTNRKEKQQTSVDLECWADNGWAKIKRVIRHKTKKKIYRVNTHCGVIDVTEDHSLMNSKKEKIKPKDCIVSETELFHSYPKFDIQEPLHLNEIVEIIDEYDNYERTIEEKEAFIFGLFFADGSCGKYNTKSGIKYTWAINKANRKLIEMAKKYLIELYRDSTNFKILETIKSSGCLKLVPKGSIKVMVDKFRDIFYNKDKLKIIPDKILNSDYNVRLNFFIGYFSGDGSKCRNSRVKTIRFSNKGKIGSSHLYYLVKSLGYECSIQVRKDKLNIYRLNCCIGTDWRRKQRKKPYVVKKMLDLGYNNENEFVYDIETEHECFNGGVGEIIPKNTDSVFVNFKVPDKIVEEHGLFSDKSLDWTIKIAQESGELITHGMWKGKRELVPLPSPHDLEYEKTYLPFILFSKKRYAGWLYEFDTKKPKYLDCKGIILKRRDNCRFLKKIYEGCLYRILNNQLDDSISFLRKSLNDILNNHTLKKYPMSDFIISKTVKSLDKYKVVSKTQDILDQLYEKIEKLKLEDEKKNMKMINTLNEKVVYYELRKVNIAHVMLALRQKQRDPGNAFASNDRVPYCFVEVEGNQKNLLQGDRIETPAYITKENIPLDYLYYIERQLEKPIMQLFEQVDPRAAQLFKDIRRIGTNRKKNLTEITKFFIEEIDEEEEVEEVEEKVKEEENKDDIKSPKKVKKKKKKKKSRIVLEEDSSSDIELPVRRRRKKKIVRKKIK